MKKVIAVVAMLMLTGCAGLTIGNYPYPSEADAAPEDKSMAKIDAEQFVAFEKIEGYTPDFALVGIVVPFIPMGQWKWLTGISKDDLRINLNLWLTPKVKSAQFSPGSLRVKVGNQEYMPTEIKAGTGLCNSNEAATVDASKPLPVTEKTCIRFYFANLHSPEEPFIVTASELPTVRFSLENKVRYEFLSQ